MREVRVRYTGAQLMGTDFRSAIEVLEQMTLMGTLWRQPENEFIRQVVDIEMKNGYDVYDLQKSEHFIIEDVLSTRKENGLLIHTTVLQNRHPLSAIGSNMDAAVVVPGSTFGSRESICIIRGTPEGCHKMVEGFRKWKEPNSISVVDTTQDDENGVMSELTGHQKGAFAAAWSMGYYDKPRTCSAGDVASKISLARVTLSGHLRTVEKLLADRLAKSLGLEREED